VFDSYQTALREDGVRFEAAVDPMLGIGGGNGCWRAEGWAIDVPLVFDNALVALGENLGHEIEPLTTT
jgi:hypothetical protein